jgi:hypothetical protein
VYPGFAVLLKKLTPGFMLEVSGEKLLNAAPSFVLFQL